MVFDSLQFVLFFVVVCCLYFSIPHKFRWLVLLTASCYFYMAFVPVYILILGFTIVVDYYAGLFIEKKSGHLRRLILIGSLITNIGILSLFKYYNFIAENINAAIFKNHSVQELPYLTILLPIGLSFHTFQAMSYTIEVFRGNQKAEKRFEIYALYVMFFPQLVAGPIERPQNLLHQFYEIHEFDSVRITAGLKQMLIGFLKKLVIADRVAIYVNTIYGNVAEESGKSLACATVFFAFQIYCDFSAYSDIAIGAAKVLGFDLMTNFRRPYLANSVSEFWRRWHISLSTWFRDYIYFPLGGSKVNRTYKKFRNIGIVFLLSGLWHGANWTFIVWGSLNGFYMICESIFKPKNANSSRSVNVLGTLITFVLISISWIFFRAQTVNEGFQILVKILRFDGDLYLGNPKDHFYYSLIGIVLLLTVEIINEYYSGLYRMLPRTMIARYGYYATIIILILLFGVFDGGQFIYFQF